MPDSRPLRVVVRAPNWLGDLIMALPTLAAVRGYFPSATLVVAAPAPLRPILEAVSGVDAVVPLAADDRRQDVRTLADGRFDIGILLTNSFRSAWTLRRAGIPERWGYRTDLRGWLLSRSVRRPRRYGQVVHQADYYRALVGGLGISPSALASGFAVTDAMKERGRTLLERCGVDPGRLLVGVAPGAAYGHAKRWPPERFAELIAAASRERGATAVLLGTAADRDAAAEIESMLAASGTWPSARAVVNLVGQTDLRSLAGVLWRCRALVTNDSGAMHLAAAVGIPVVAIFGPTDERATAPAGRHMVLTHPVWCRPCHLRECPIDHRCMKRITAARALEALGAMLDRPSV